VPNPPTYCSRAIGHAQSYCIGSAAVQGEHQRSNAFSCDRVVGWCWGDEVCCTVYGEMVRRAGRRRMQDVVELGRSGSGDA
jgi:hypothetical protein